MTEQMMKPHRLRSVRRKDMKFRHRVNITVSQPDGSEQRLLKAADCWLPRKIVEWLFGDYQQVYLITPGMSIEGIQINEVKNDDE